MFLMGAFQKKNCPIFKLYSGFSVLSIKVDKILQKFISLALKS